MADDTNEDSWLYGTSNPDSTTNEISNGSDALAAEHEALAAVTGEKPGTGALPAFPKEELLEYAEFEDPAKEMEEDEEALPDTTDGNARIAPGADLGASGLDDAGSQEDSEMADLMEVAPGTMPRKERNGSGSDDDDDDDSDDDINVVIGDIKSAPSTYNIKQRPNLLAGATAADKAKPTAQAGKFSIEDFEGAGTINGVAVHEFSIDSLEEKPWRKPGADITDYFNYGFNEETWRAYCERQKRFRVAESGVGLASLTQNVNQSATSMGMPDGGNSGGLSGPMGMGGPMHHHQPLVVLGDGPMQMPPPGMPPMMQHQPRPGMGMMARPPRPISTTGGVKENAIQVMTAECREYSRGGLGPMAPNFPPPGAADEPFFHEPEPFDYGYEPTQESQWGNDNAGWVPTGIKELTPGPVHHPPQQQQQQPPPQIGGPPGMPQMNVPPPQMGGPPPQLRGQHAPPGMMPPNMRMPHNIGMGPPPGMMRMPHNMNMGPQQRMPMGSSSGNSNNSNMPAASSSDRRSESYDDDRERRRREKDKQLKKEQLRKDFLDMLRERHDIERHTRWYDIKKKFESDPRYRALDSAYREEYFEDYLHILKEEKRKERDHKERDRERSNRDKERSRDKDKDKEKEKDKEKDKDKDKDKEKEGSSRREGRSRSRDKSSRRKSKSREKDRSERSSKQSTSSTSNSSSRSEKKKSHRKEKEEEE
ncbi:pre-mRNA 3'-end-processing factor FIP1 [Drosophila novamexicana]|uniref:pre-mRNA 3'-end-processing factor FIP1 n=1 Tax=Drosophila novamexicana TaxID=47314 RepID=UPI0011E58DD4|nr:pre-mRNA 3'-end-processing factor FIP1 [Drosophila novamexicana]